MRERQCGASLVIAALAFIVPACTSTSETSQPGGSTSSSAPTSTVLSTTTVPPSTTTTIPGISYRFTESLAQEDRDLIRQGIELGRAYVTDKIAPLKQSIVVSNSLRADAPGTAEASGHDIIVYSNTDVWVGSTAWQKLKILAHEYFHVIQGELTQVAPPRSPLGPTWMGEGSAEFVGFSALVEANIISRSFARRDQGLDRGALRYVDPLSSLETRAGWQESNSTKRQSTYSLGYAVVELLVSKTGVSSIGDFFSGLSKTNDWARLFEQVFGQSVQAFYDEVTTTLQQ